MDIEIIGAIVLIAGGWLLEIVGAKRVEKWLVNKQIAHKKGNGIIARLRRSRLYMKERGTRKEPVWWALAYIIGLVASFGGIILLLYLKGTNRI